MQPRSTRLNEKNRSLFVRTVLEDVLPSVQPEQIKKAFYDRWNPQVYDIFCASYMDYIDKLPSWMKCKIKQFTVQIKGSRSMRDRVTFDLPHAITIPQHEFPVTPTGHLLEKEYQQMQQTLNDYQTKRRELDNQLSELVKGCNTSGQLYVAWPQALKYYECFPYIEPSKHTGATVSQEELALGLKMAQVNIKLPHEN